MNRSVDIASLIPSSVMSSTQTSPIPSKVDHSLLLKKVKSYGIQGNLYKWIEQFLLDRPMPVISGVPLGTVLRTSELNQSTVNP